MQRRRPLITREETMVRLDKGEQQGHWTWIDGTHQLERPELARYLIRKTGETHWIYHTSAEVKALADEHGITDDL